MLKPDNVLFIRVYNWIQSFFHKRGPFFLGNLAILYTFLWLMIPSFYYISDDPWILGRYSLKYFAFLVSLVLSIIVYASLVFWGTKRINLYLFLSFMACFLAGETFARSLPLGGTGSDVYLRFPIPYMDFGGRPGATMIQPSMMGGTSEDGVSVLNELGFRGAFPSRDKSDEIRIIVLGGSAVIFGTPISNSIPGQLELLFHKNGQSNVRVYNWGVLASVSGQELSWLVHTVPDYKPDLVIVYDGGNDLSLPYHSDPRPGYPLNWMMYEAGLDRIQSFDPIHQPLEALLVKSQLVSTLFREPLLIRIANMYSLRGRVGYRSQAWEESITSTYLENTRKMCAVADGFHFKLAVFLQPMIQLKDPLIGKERSLLGGMEFQRYIIDAYKRLSQGIEEMKLDQSGNRKCYIFDSSTIFAHYDDEVFWDFIHVDNAGNKFVAGQIYDYLMNDGVLDR
ncbi:MAG: hypothetical protein HY326_04485 [Chloroflexi bacterium]|nr:hypothetical protein [Chloroflexota bacterium]